MSCKAVERSILSARAIGYLGVGRDHTALPAVYVRKHDHVSLAGQPHGQVFRVRRQSPFVMEQDDARKFSFFLWPKLKALNLMFLWGSWWRHKDRPSGLYAYRKRPCWKSGRLDIRFAVSYTV